MSGITYVGFSRDAYKLKTRVSFRIGFIYIGTGSRQSSKPGPDVQDADDAVPSEKYALVLG
jgi:hypothetical protein